MHEVIAPAISGALTTGTTLLTTMTLDRFCGELPPRWHPVVAMGRYLRAAAPGLLALRPCPALWAGGLAWATGALACTLLAWALQAALTSWHTPNLLSAVLLGLLLKPLLAWRMLRDEVAAVEAALARSLPEARARVARLVSRDATRLNPLEVREAAIESLAENLNDSVLAPLFWFAVAGLPGAALYRFANTADAMWGYRGRWEWAGKCAARADDLLSWLPARLCALLLCLAAWRVPALHSLRVDAASTPSPNGGWPMATMARLLGCRLAKPGSYCLHAKGRTATPGDTERAVRWAGRTTMLAATASGVLAAALRSAS
jgi:adenosylcobinamide-phosphate synthase